MLCPRLTCNVITLHVHEVLDWRRGVMILIYRKTLIIQISYALQYAKCNKVTYIYECCRDCLLIKID